MPQPRAPTGARMLGLRGRTGTGALLLEPGAWRAEPEGGGRSSTRVERLQVYSGDGSPESGPPAAAWADARDLRAELSFGADGSFHALSADAGRLRPANPAQPRWDAARGALRGTLPPTERRAASTRRRRSATATVARA